MKCPKCGYNSFDSLNECKRCGARLETEMPGPEKGPANPHKSGSLHDDIENFALFENEDSNDNAYVLEDEFIDDYSYHGAPQTTGRSPGTQAGDSPESYLVLASISRRFFAFILDCSVIVVLSFFTIVVGLLAAGINLADGIMKLSYILIPVYLILCLFASTILLFLHAYSGKSFGKLVLGLRVVREDGGKISTSQSFARWIGYYLSAIPVFYGYISAIFDFNLQSWHDKIAKTYVVRD